MRAERSVHQPKLTQDRAEGGGGALIYALFCPLHTVSQALVIGNHAPVMKWDNYGDLKFCGSASRGRSGHTGLFHKSNSQKVTPALREGPQS